MSWIDPVDAQTPWEAVLGQRPELLSRYRAFYRTLWEDDLIPRRLLEICRLRIAAIHGCAQEWMVRDAEVALAEPTLRALKQGDFGGFDPAEQAALAVAEQIPYAHHQISDEEVAALKSTLGEPATVALLTALAFFDVTCRLKLVLEVDEQPAELQQPPLLKGALV